MAPRPLGLPAMHSMRAMNLHFCLHITGLVLYLTSMWAAGITEGVMWRATNPDGTHAHSFLASLIAIQPYYVIRVAGGVLVLTAMVVIAWNLWYTASDAREGLCNPIVV